MKHRGTERKQLCGLTRGIVDNLRPDCTNCLIVYQFRGGRDMRDIAADLPGWDVLRVEDVLRRTT